MIDLHTHFIPNVDDGADSMAETLRLAQSAVEEGVSHAVMTPHHNRQWVINEKDKVIKLTKEVQKAIQAADIPLTVSPGQEIRMNEEFLDELFAGNYLSLDENGKYYLVEFSWGDFPAFAKSYLEQMIAADMTPVIAHPERQRAFLEDPELLPSLIEMGCLAQVTATSIIGGYSDRVTEAAYQMMQDQLIHIIASDAHDTVERPLNFEVALAQLEKDFGLDYKNYLVDNAREIFEGSAIKPFEKNRENDK